tara:strand:+ start:59 stop:397 length:339 start_codon:yes stop_codon:yes gene_type:complete
MNWVHIANKKPVAKKVLHTEINTNDVKFKDMKQERCKKEYVYRPDMLYSDTIDNPLFETLSDYFIENGTYTPIIQLTNINELYEFFNPYIDKLSSIDMNIFNDYESSEEDYM